LAPVHAAGEGILQTEDVGTQHGGDGQQEGKAHGKPPLEAHEAAGGDGHAGAGDAGDRGDSLTDAHHQHIQHRGAAGILASLTGPVAEKQQEAGDDQGGADEYHTVLQALHRVLDGQDGKQGQRTQNDQQDQAAGRGYRRRGAVVDQITDAAEKFPHHVADVLPIGHEHRHQRTQMQQYVVEGGDLGVDVQQILGDGQMARAGDGQKFRHALDQAQKNRLQKGHRFSPYLKFYQGVWPRIVGRGTFYHTTGGQKIPPLFLDNLRDGRRSHSYQKKEGPPDGGPSSPCAVHRVRM